MDRYYRSGLAALLLAMFALVSPARANVPCSVPFTLTNGTTADATQVMANYNALIACLTNAAAAGANSDITSLNALSTPIPPTSGGSTQFVATLASGGSANAQTIAATIPANFSLVLGYTVVFKVGLTNTGATTLTVGSAATTNVFKFSPGGPVALTGGELQIGDVATVAFDGTQYQLIDVHRQVGGFDGPAASIASAANTDIASTGSHFVNVTGTTTITSFGNTLANQTAFPRYLVTLNGSQVNFNATSCATVGGCIATPGSVNFSTSSAGETVILRYLGQGSNGGAGAGNWLVESVPRSAQGIGRQVTNPQVIQATGTYTPTVGMLFAKVECLGGGGAGGGNTAISTTGGGGGGEGGYAVGLFSAATIGASQSVTIGAAGVGASGVVGGNGGNTTFGALLTANGGTGGAVGNSSNTSFLGGAGGTASGGYLNITGTQGGPALAYESNGVNNVISGAGGSSLYGAGGRSALAAISGNQSGIAATGFGAGGSGSTAANSSGTAQAGGNGSIGVCIVTEFIE